MRALETLLFLPHPSRILGWPRGRKWVQSDMRPLETSLFRLHPSRILGWSRGNKWVPSDWPPLETSLSRHHQSRISGLSIGRKWLLIAICHLNCRFIDLKKSNFRLVKKQKLISKWHSTTWIIAFRIHQIAYSASPEDEDKLRMPFETLKLRFF